MKGFRTHIGKCSRIFAACLCLMLLLSCGMAAAEHYEGKTVALTSTLLTGECEAQVERLNVSQGSTVQQGDTLLTYKLKSVYADIDGTVAAVKVQAGEKANGETVSVNPAYQYLIYCSTDGAYVTAKNHFVHNGELLYVKCTKNGTHRAMGIVTQIDGNDYQLETTAGKLYIGETVYLYRTSDFSYLNRVGEGTVVSAPVQSYEAEGNIIEMKVSPGDSVEKGQLLFTYIAEGNGSVMAEADGIISETHVSQGDQVEENGKLLTLVKYEDIGIEITVSGTDAANIKPGDHFSYTLNSDPESIKHTATVQTISAIASESGYTLLLKPEEALTYLGMGVQVQIEY